MSTTKSASGSLKPVLVDQKKKPKGKKVIDWGILLKKDTPDEEKILKKLLTSVQTHDFHDDLNTISLQYQWFKSKEVKQLHNLWVFRQTEESTVPAEGKKNGSFFEHADEVPSRTSGPRPPKPPSGVLEIFERDLTLSL